MIGFRFSLWQLLAFVAACAVAALLDPELLLWLLSLISAAITFAQVA